VLHAGHVRLLEAARRLGDQLVVCLNGDLSVRRLKGPHRPINRAEDRAAVLHGLGCVDDVVVFDEDTPCEALRRLRPALFVKGGDYAGRHLPERAVLAEWGGRVVLLPVVPGRSTTRILQAAAASTAAAV
jgi:D-beta-D-heptose 7-phosphate kinase / D-beta-D-heptose 1-phosphate adenosyltransferase